MAGPSGGGGAGAAKPKTRSNTLRQAASAVFALTTVLPLLLFVWTVHTLGVLTKLQAQVGLGLALAIALLGFWVFRRLMGQMSDLILALRRAAEFATRSGGRPGAEAPRAPVEPAAGGWARAAPPPTPAASRPAVESAPPTHPEPASVTAPESPVPTAWAAPAPPPASLTFVTTVEGMSPQTAETHTVPGLGAIREVHDLSRAMEVLWRAEAAEYRGRRVAVSILGSARPIVGTLIELTDEGILVQTGPSERRAVSFSRISAIDAEESPAEE